VSQEMTSLMCCSEFNIYCKCVVEAAEVAMGNLRNKDDLSNESLLYTHTHLCCGRGSGKRGIDGFKTTMRQ